MSKQEPSGTYTRLLNMITGKKYIVFLAVFVVYFLTAIHSNGYHHPDEHYQLIEFAGLIDGWNTGKDLTWEYDAQIRPTLQPMVALGVFKCLHLFGMKDPFLLSMSLRLLTALLSLGCIGIFIRGFLPTVKEAYRMAFVLLSFLLWFLPAINVRFSSETWAGLMLLLAVFLIYRKQKRMPLNYMGIGVLCGLSFVFRFQMAIAIVGLLLWLIFIRKERAVNLLYLLVGGGIVVAVEFFLDSWFYGNWVFTPLNYFQCNIMDDMASNFGVSPWFFYLNQTIERATPLIGLLILISLLGFFVFEFKHIITWILLPFLLVHSLIPHKELRFLFPIVNFLPLILILIFQKVRSLWQSSSAKTVLYPVWGIALLVNVGGLVMLAFKPASDGNIEMLRYIDRHYDRVNLYSIGWSNPYTLGNIKGLTPRFYANDKVNIKDLSKILNDPHKKLNDNDLVMLLTCYHEHPYLEEQGFTVEKRSIPARIEWMDQFYHVYTEYRYVFVLYSKSGSNPDK